VIALVDPAPPIEQLVAAVSENWLFAPAQETVTDVIAELEVPVLVRVTYGAAGAVVTQVIVPAVPVPNPAAVSVVPVTWIWADWADVPKTPKTKPPIATAAIRVTAIIRTVAIIGDGTPAESWWFQTAYLRILPNMDCE
jgi:hypothetical protein